MVVFRKKQLDTPRRRQVRPNEPRTIGDVEEGHTFRRNRTLTGSTSSKIVSTNESKVDLKSPRVHAHDLTRKRRHIGVALLVVLVCAGLLYWLISQFTAGVVVEAQDVTIKLDPSYATTIENYFAHQPAERLRFLLNQQTLSDYVQAADPEISSIQEDGSAGFGKSLFTVTLRTPIAGWSVNGQQQYVDASGTSFGRNYFATPSVEIVDDSGAQVAAGQAVASNAFLGFVGRLIGFAKDDGYKVSQVILPQDTTRQVELKLDGINYPIKFSVDRPAGEQVEDMERSIKWFSSHNVSPQYLDVRVSGKAFYR